MAMLAIGPSPTNLTEIPLDPAELTWGLQDISASAAGRVEDAGNTMFKMRTSQKRKLSIVWHEPDIHVVSVILKLVNPEYFYARYWDLMDDEWQVREFYVGDRSAPYRYFGIPELGSRASTLSFDIIER